MARALPDHLKVPWRVRDAFTVYVAAWIGLPIVAVILVRVLAPYIGFFNNFLTGLRASAVGADFILVLIDAIGAMLLVGYYLRRYKLSWASVGWRKFSVWRAFALVGLMFIIFTLGVVALTALVSLLDPSFNANQAQTNDFTGASGGPVHHSIALIALVIIPPIIEETVFRGFIFPALSKKFGLIFGAVTTSILFGFAHLQANVSIYTFVLSLALCFMYVKLKSIVPGIGLHMLNNYLAFIALTSK